MSGVWAAAFAASPSVLGAALAIDLVFGELPALAHPVVWMGRVARRLERLLPTEGVARQLFGGALLATLVPFGFAAASLALLGFTKEWPLAHWLLEVLVLTAMFAARALGDAAQQVAQALHAGKLERARFGLRSLCSRDASRLTEPELIGATIESVAENASDSFVAPILYYVLFGLPGAVVYRAVNTLDAMVGYRGRYEYLGKASARLDDVLNFVPARVTAALLLLAGALVGQDARRGLAIWRRDAATTASPNAGRPMAAMAGLLGVRLEKPGHYGLGDARVALAGPHISTAWRVVRLAFALTALLALAAAAHWG
ncbi:MAG: adenosylcobinamide-phosphate synthase CbiB [Deltaproteobacteria bacterium]